MNDEVKNQAKEILAIIADAKKYTEVKDFHSLFMDAESIISTLAYLIGPLRDQEQKYRLLVVELKSTGESVSGAEAIAKASDEYKEFKKLEDVYELAQEQIMLLKKFKSDLELEYKHS